MGQLGRAGVTTHAALTDVSTPHVLADLEAAVCSETEALAIAKAALDYPMKLEQDIARWVIPGWQTLGASTVVTVANRVYYTPIFVVKDTTYIRIAIEVTTFAAGNADLRIFNFADGLPTSLVLSAGTVDTGTNGLKEITIAQLLTRGYYFLAVRYTATPTIRCVDITAPLYLPAGAYVFAQQFNQTSHLLFFNGAYADPADPPSGSLDAGSQTIMLREN